MITIKKVMTHDLTELFRKIGTLHREPHPSSILICLQDDTLPPDFQGLDCNLHVSLDSKTGVVTGWQREATVNGSCVLRPEVNAAVQQVREQYSI